MHEEQKSSLYLSGGGDIRRRLAGWAGRGVLFAVTSLSAAAVLFIVYFIGREAVPFFQDQGAREFFLSNVWYPSAHPPHFGALAIFYGTLIVTAGAVVIAVPLGVCAAVCLSDILPFSVRQVVKPIIEILAAIPSVVYGFFALVVLAPFLQHYGGRALAVATWIVGLPSLSLGAMLLAGIVADRLFSPRFALRSSLMIFLGLETMAVILLYRCGDIFYNLEIASGTNALNVSIILGVMALPTIVSVSEDAMQSVGPEIRAGSYALGATRAETIIRVVLPAAAGGILAAVILGVMRAVGETMVVWMASGNAAVIPTPFYNLLAPVRTVTATIAGDMGEADQVTGSARYHVLFAMALCLLVVSLAMNLVSEYIVAGYRRRQNR